MQRSKASGQALADTTKIIIAQRITSVMDSDQIIILEDGEIHAAREYKKPPRIGSDLSGALLFPAERELMKMARQFSAKEA